MSKRFCSGYFYIHHPFSFFFFSFSFSFSFYFKRYCTTFSTLTPMVPSDLSFFLFRLYTSIIPHSSSVCPTNTLSSDNEQAFSAQLNSPKFSITRFSFWEEVQPTYYPRIQNFCWWGRYRRSILFFTLPSFTLLREMPTLVFSRLRAFDWTVIEWSCNDCATIIARPLTHRFMIVLRPLHHRV